MKIDYTVNSTNTLQEVNWLGGYAGARPQISNYMPWHKVLDRTSNGQPD